MTETAVSTLLSLSPRLAANVEHRHGSPGCVIHEEERPD